MKAGINSKGTLVVAAENDLEAYALGKWSKDYAAKVGNIETPFVIDCGSYKDTCMSQERIN